MSTPDPRQRAAALQLYGVLAHWSECANQPWLNPLLDWEEAERGRRSLERRLRCAHIGRFKPLADFDWAWPEQCDQRAIAELMTLDFLGSATNAILIGSSGLGKTMIAQNIAHQAVLQGHTVLFATAGQLLGELAGLDSDSALRYRLRRYAAPDLLVIDEVERVPVDADALPVPVEATLARTGVQAHPPMPSSGCAIELSARQACPSTRFATVRKASPGRKSPQACICLAAPAGA